VLASSLADTLLPDSAVHYKWKEISDLPADIEQFRDRELESLYQVWLDQRAIVDEKAFAAELGREWSIETGVIEGVYTLERGTTEILIRRGIDSSYIARESTNRDPELVAKIIQAHQDALEGLFDFVAQRRELSSSYIKELHSALLRHQDVVEGVDQFGTKIYIELKKGLYKEHPNSPTRRDKAVHEYCPPEHVASEMDRLIEFHKQHVRRDIPALVEAAWLHHAFAQIHPFQDGNGRVARSLASLILIRGGFFPLVVHRDDWEKYIDALEAADGGDLSALVNLFARLQKRELTRAISRAVEATPVATIDEAVALTRDLLVDLKKIAPPEFAAARTSARKLYDATLTRITDLVKKLHSEIGHANRNFGFSIGETSISNDVLRAFAETFKYLPNARDHSQNIQLNLSGQDATARIAVSFHTVGAAFRGLIAAVPYFQLGEDPLLPLSDDVFRIDYKEPYQDLEERYTKWLDACLIQGLAEWRKTLV
jgi:Fic family protein